MTEEQKQDIKYITAIFPIIDIPFGILCVLYSQNWLTTLIIYPFFAIISTISIILSMKYKWQPGYLIFSSNSILFPRTFDYMMLPRKNIEEKNKIVEQKNKEITDSLHYAKRIQKAIMPGEKQLEKYFQRYKK